MTKVLIVALMLTGLAIVSCKKDDNNSAPVTATDLIATGTWQIDTIGFDSDNNGTIDFPFPGGFQACELDNTLTFQDTTHTGLYDEGALKCDVSDPQTVPFQWELKNNDSTINFSGDLPAEIQGDFSILSLTNTQFIVSKRVVLTFPVQFDKNLIVSLKK